MKFLIVAGSSLVNYKYRGPYATKALSYIKRMNGELLAVLDENYQGREAETLLFEYGDKDKWLASLCTADEDPSRSRHILGHRQIELGSEGKCDALNIHICNAVEQNLANEC